MARRGQRGRTALSAAALLGAASLFVPQLLGFVAGIPRASSPRLPATSRYPVRRAAAPADLLEDKKVESKARLLDLLSDETVLQEVMRPEGKPMRGQLDEMILALERLNPCDEPAYSELLDGTWSVKYSGSYAPGLLSSPTRELALFLYGGGFSLGNALSSFALGFWGQSAGLKLGPKTVTIKSGRDAEATAEIEVGGQKQTLAYSAELLPLSAQRLNEEVVAVDLPGPLGKRDAPFELRRSILVTFLDDEVMIVRDESGVPEVLLREKVEGEAWASTPQSASVPDAKDAASQPEEPADDLDASEDPLSSDAA